MYRLSHQTKKNRILRNGPQSRLQQVLEKTTLPVTPPPWRAPSTTGESQSTKHHRRVQGLLLYHSSNSTPVKSTKYPQRVQGLLLYHSTKAASSSLRVRQVDPVSKVRWRAMEEASWHHLIHVHTHTEVNIPSHTHTHTRTCAHTSAHTHTYTHTTHN